MEGAKLVYEDNEWAVYEITTHKAAVLYGSGTKWCIDDPFYKIAIVIQITFTFTCRKQNQMLFQGESSELVYTLSINKAFSRNPLYVSSTNVSSVPIN